MNPDSHTGPFIEKKNKEKKRNLRCSNKILSESTPLGFLYCFALIHLGYCGFSGCWDWGRRGKGGGGGFHLGFAKNSSGKGSEESGMSFEASG